MAYTSQNTRAIHSDRSGSQIGSGRRISDIIAQGVYLIIGIIEALLGIRLLLSLLGANQSNMFASFIYEASRPLVAPFQGLFNFQPEIGVARFDIETIVAMIVYSFVALLIIRLITIQPNKRSEF